MFDKMKKKKNAASDAAGQSMTGAQNTEKNGREKKPLKERMKSFAGSTGFRYGGYSTALIAVVFVILLVLNLFVGQLPSKYIHIDTSSTGYYTIGDTTKGILSDLQEDISIYVLASEDEADTVIKELLTRYQDLSDHIKVTYVDTAVNPGFAAEYDASDATSDSLVIVGSKRSKVVDYYDIYVSEMDYETYYTTGEYSSTTDFDGEGQITSAIDYVISDDLPVMYTLTGHGESALDDSIASEVSKINITSEELNLMTAGSIPEDAGAILINQPTKDLSEDEEQLLQDYMDAGGSVLVIPSLLPDEEMTNLNTFLDHYGMTLTNSVVIEGDSSYYYQYPYYLLPEVESTDITDPILDEGTSVLLLQSQAITVSSDLRESLTVSSMLETSDSAYAKDLNNGQLNSYEKESGDAAGPFVLAAAATEDNDDGSTAHLVVIASDYLLDSDVIENLPVANQDVFLNSLSWMCSHESTISISSKSMDATNLVVSSSVTVVFMVLTMFLIPVGILAVGFFVWLGRRKK